MKTFHAAIVAILGALTTACPGEKTPAPASGPARESSAVETGPAASTLVDGATPEAPRKLFRRFDPAGKLLHAANTPLTINGEEPAPLRAEQLGKAEQIGRKLVASDIPPAKELTALNEVLVAGLRAGRIDGDRLSSARSDLRAAMGPVLDAEVQALNELHALLDATQRIAAANSVRASQTVLRPRRVTGHVTTSKLEGWLADIGLASPKKEKVAALIPSPQALSMKSTERYSTVMRAFEKDEFDAKNLDVLDARKTAPMPLDSETTFLQKLIPLLSAEERAKVADAIEKEGVSEVRD